MNNVTVDGVAVNCTRWYDEKDNYCTMVGEWEKGSKMSNRLDEIFTTFTTIDEKGYRVCNGKYGSRNVNIRRENGEGTRIEEVDIVFNIPTGKRKDLYMEVAFTDNEVKIVTVYGKESLTCTDAMRVAQHYGVIVHMCDRLRAML